MAVRGPRVVVVEDDGSMREAVVRLLGVGGFEVTAHASAEALLADASALDPACVVSDLRLPGMSGLELLDELHSLGWRAPAILITAYDAPGLCAEAVRRGAAAYLVKPFLGRALLDAVRAAVNPDSAPRPRPRPDPPVPVNSADRNPSGEQEGE